MFQCTHGAAPARPCPRPVSPLASGKRVPIFAAPFSPGQAVACVVHLVAEFNSLLELIHVEKTDSRPNLTFYDAFI